MRIYEYQIPLHMTVEECNIAQLYMVMHSSESETDSEKGEGVEVLKNEPYDNTDGHMGTSAISGVKVPKNAGQYTLKHFHFASKLPTYLVSLVPADCMVLIEEAWNAYPRCLTVITSAYLSKERFYVAIESNYVDGFATLENALDLTSKELKLRKIEKVNICSTEGRKIKDDTLKYDPTQFVSKKTGRGPLLPADGSWCKEKQPVMTVYKVCRMNFGYWGFQNKVEDFILSQQQGIMWEASRKAQCLMDEWFGLTIQEIRQMEEKAANDLNVLRNLPNNTNNTIFTATQTRVSNDDDILIIMQEHEGGGSMMDQENSDAMSELALPSNLMRNLGDRSYDKRKSSAMEVENLIKQLQEAQKTRRIHAIVVMLGQDFACSTNANHRKGGLIGLAATAIGLMHDAEKYLDLLLPPVLHCFDDPESRVRYYACESLYNIAKVARGSILAYFNQIFDGLCKLFADVDVDVKNGANLLDRLVKDIVTESETFNVDTFIPLLQKYIKMTNPYIRQLLVGWITVLDSVPDIDMLDWLPSFLDGIFNMLSDGNREIRQAADSALAEFLREIKQTAYVDFGPMVTILVAQCSSKQRFNRLTAMTWVHEFVDLGQDRLSTFYADILGAIMYCISDAEHEIRQVAERANDDLLQLVKSTKGDVDLLSLMNKLNLELLSSHIPTRMAALKWISMLLEKAPQQLEQHIDSLLPTLLKTLSDVSDSVVLLDLEVIARISLNQTEFTRVLKEIIKLFYDDRRFLETRGSLIVRKLCVLLEAKEIYMVFANVINEESKEKPEFASVMVQTLNLILLTASELAELRSVLKRSFDKNASASDALVFSTLFKTWCNNPIATFSLCLLAQAYDLSYALINKFADIEVNVGFLMQIDKLVQLLESPIFIHLRLQMLDTDKPYHAPLMKSLYGLLMLLPQSAAFKVLLGRLGSVNAMTSAIDPDCAKTPSKVDKKEVVKLLEQFEAVQMQQSSPHSKEADKRKTETEKK